MNEVIVLSGSPGAGASLVADALCERFDRMLLIEVDELRHWVRAGYRHPWAGDHQAQEQREMAIRNACAAARESVAMRYSVVITDLVLPEQATRYGALLAPLGPAVPVHLVTLLAAGGAEALPERERALSEALRAAAAEGALPGAVLDTTHDSDARVTADRVQDLVARGASLLA